MVLVGPGRVYFGYNHIGVSLGKGSGPGLRVGGFSSMHLADNQHMMGKCEHAEPGHSDTEQFYARHSEPEARDSRGTSLPSQYTGHFLLFPPIPAPIGPGSMEVWRVAMTTKSSNPSPSLSKMGRGGGDAAIKDNVFALRILFQKPWVLPSPREMQKMFPEKALRDSACCPFPAPPQCENFGGRCFRRWGPG